MKKFNVLLVDDEPELLDMIELMLKEEDYNIIKATNANDAIKILKRKKVGVNRHPKIKNNL